MIQCVNKHIGKPHVWGILDCVLLAFLCIDAMYLTEEYDRFKNKWDSAETAYKYMLTNRISFECYALNVLGASEIKHGYETVGDIIMYRNNDHRLWNIPAIYLGDGKSLTVVDHKCVMMIYKSLLPEITGMLRIS